MLNTENNVTYEYFLYELYLENCNFEMEEIFCFIHIIDRKIRLKSESNSPA